MKKIVAREETFSQRKNMFEHFDKLITGSVDSILLDSVKNIHLIFSGLPFPGPVAQASVNISTLNSWLDGLKSSFQTDTNILIAWDNKNKSIKAYSDTTEICSFQLSSIVENDLISLLMDFQTWSGELTESGEHRMGLKGKAPGPHFFINMLLGNRVGFPHPLQTTPKSVVDRFGRGSFRSHADTQVLATRWDILQEENGNPCNRQFYLFEGNEQIFYSADVNDDNIVEAECLHSQNSTTINYNTRCGLEIRRKFFLPVQKSELPLACEIQEISITNNTKEKRNIRLVYTGMFGSGKPGALQEDVLYSTIIMQAGVIKDNDNRIVAISPDYYPMDTREDLRFHSMKIHRQSDIGLFPSEFSTSYQEFFGNGSLEKPQGAFYYICGKLYRTRF
jgi:cellobiose phosphorylase